MGQDISAFFTKLIRETGVIGKVAVKSALESLNWIIFVYLVFIIVVIGLKPETWILIVIIFILIALILAYLFFYYYLLKNAPDYLRSETYQLQKYQMEMMGEQDKELPAQIIEKEKIIKKPELLRKKNTKPL